MGPCVPVLLPIGEVHANAQWQSEDLQKNERQGQGWSSSKRANGQALVTAGDDDLETGERSTDGVDEDVVYIPIDRSGKSPMTAAACHPAHGSGAMAQQYSGER